MKTVLQQSTDNQLVKSFQEGNNNSLEVLLDRHKDKLYSSILFLVKDKYLAEDLFQELFIKIIDKLRNNRYNEEGKFIQWASRIAHNLCVDHFRKIKRTPPIVTSDKQDIFEIINVVEENPEHGMINMEMQGGIRAIIEKLPAEQREVIVLRHFADMSFKEIAEITNCSINTALGRMRYGLLNLRKLIAQNQIEL